MTKQETELVQQVIDCMYEQLNMEHCYCFIQKDMEHKDPRDRIYYMGGQKAMERQLDALKELAESYGVRFGPKPEPRLKLVVNRK